MVTPRYLADSVLGPSLFIFYINDLQDRLRSTVRLFADDTIAYLTIASEDDAEHLQEDLDKLANFFLPIVWFPSPKKTPRYNINIIESGIKHHNPLLN
jgi:hypothetical protein